MRRFVNYFRFRLPATWIQVRITLSKVEVWRKPPKARKKVKMRCKMPAADQNKLCRNCLPLLQGFCQMYDLWCKLQLGMNQRLQKIAPLIRRSSSKSPDIKSELGLSYSKSRALKVSPEAPNDFKIKLLMEGKVDTPLLKFKSFEVCMKKDNYGSSGPSVKKFYPFLTLQFFCLNSWEEENEECERCHNFKA